MINDTDATHTHAHTHTYIDTDTYTHAGSYLNVALRQKAIKQG